MQQSTNQKKRVNLTTTIGLVVVVALISFILGSRSDNILASLASAQNKNTQADLSYHEVEEVYDKLRLKFDGQLDPAKLIEGAKKGLVEAAGDPYTTYFTTEEAKEFMSDLQGTFSGIGAELDRRDNQLRVTSTLDGSPARKAGLMAADVIVRVNDQDASDWPVDKAVSEIRGDKGTTVKLTILRESELKEFSIVRDSITTPSVTWEILPDGVGYLRLSRFAEDTGTLAKRAAEEFKAKGVGRVILDVRGNGGGYLSASQEVASLWLDNKVIVEERIGNNVVDTLRSGSNPILGGLPTVVLVDGGSASASEIVAGALRDNGVAQLVGEKTFGKGSVQEILDLPGGSQLKVTVAKWFTPAGKNISQEGIVPDKEVKLSDQDLQSEQDKQREAAVELVKTIN